MIRQLAIRVTPGAASSRVVEAEDGTLRVYVTCKPKDGEANAAVVRLIAKWLDVAPTRVRIVRGLRSRDKVIEVTEGH